MLSKRTQIYLSEEQWQAVEDRARQLGISAAEVIRRAVDRELSNKPRFAEVLGEVAGAWAHLESIDSAFIEKMRREWEGRSGG